MEGCLNEGKLAEEKIRSMAVRLHTEVAELRRNLQLAVDLKLRAEREKRDAQEQVDTLLSELAGTRSDKAKLRHESQLVMTNVNRWITEQKHLQDSNGTLKAEVKRLKEVGDEKSRDMERFKAWIRDLAIPQEERTRVNKSPKERQIKSTPQPPQFSKNSKGPGNGSAVFC
ncbi:hypothetical protein EYF80_003346 [Liparis tanakae]|uniref:Uncharacterized protein n=1 Tax=Liparis tanakae TaxID=230148 RepID=A0A4Z2J8N8_9TELE|nr:hypothetical protein EYF80_003346 [Liparis tanakae]